MLFLPYNLFAVCIEGFASAEATKGLCGRPLETFAAFLLKSLG